MNIIATSSSPDACARALDDRRLNAFVRETAQILATGRLILRDQASPYRATHKNHPVCVWAGACEANLLWVAKYLVALSKEYEYRFGKTHLSAIVMRPAAVNVLLTVSAGVKRQPFANCAANAQKGVSFKHVRSTRSAYRQYIMARWALELESGYKPKFTRRTPPAFARHMRGDFAIA